ncbi:cytochrome c biogenesis protein ResB [Bacillus sp. 4A_MP3]
MQQTVEGSESNKYKLKFDHVETKNITGLTVRKDLTLWVLAVGGAIFMIGVIQGMYWQHRRIWIKTGDHEVLVAGHTNKNWFGLKKISNLFLAGPGFKSRPIKKNWPKIRPSEKGVVSWRS